MLRSPSAVCLAVLSSVSSLALVQPAASQPIEQTAPSFWVQHNRYAELSGGDYQQDYREQDTQGLTPDGTLDTETGKQSSIGIALRWQTANHWLVHLQAQRQSGVTNYQGYLQAGTTLTPYLAHTGNVAVQYSINLGYALNATNWSALPASWQITPLLQLGKHQWQRNLVQYSETYDYTTQAIGALVQWQPKAGTVLELQAVQGHTQSASVDAPALGFAASQPGDTFRQWQLGISQDLAALTGKEALAGWRIVARYTNSQYGHGASPLVNGLQAPPNQHRPSSWTLGLQKQF